MRIAVVEDDAALSLFLRKGLEIEGHTVTCYIEGSSALQTISERAPDLVVLDLNLPNMDGVDVLRELRKSSPESAILVLTGRSAVQDRVACLDLGADDYLLKPFSFHEMLARCRALGRRRSSTAASVVRHGELHVDRVTHAVTYAGRPIDLTGTEYALLDYLLLHRGRAVSRSELLATVWKNTPEKGTNLVDVYVNYLRRKLSGASTIGNIVETVRGAGYTISLCSTAMHLSSVAGAEPSFYQRSAA